MLPPEIGLLQCWPAALPVAESIGNRFDARSLAAAFAHALDRAVIVSTPVAAFN